MAEAGLTYAAAGVDIDAADRAVAAIRPLVDSTRRPGVLGSIGGFGGLFELPSGYRRPVLVSSTDGVGTKLAVATATGRFDTIGIDLVAMCVDDLVCSGAEPLFFLDYQLLGRVDPDQVAAILGGIAEGCRQAGCAIVGGELAEHPGLIQPGEVDLAGFAVGIVEHDAILDGPGSATAGDVLIGLPSPGLRSNGYSLARRALLGPGPSASSASSSAPSGDLAARLAAPAWAGASVSVADELLRPSVVYAPAVLAAIAAGGVRAVAHITGGGIPGNLPRVLPGHLDAVVDPTAWDRPAIFDAVATAGGVEEVEMRRVFNLGIGMVLVVAPGSVDAVVAALHEHGHRGLEIGRLGAGVGQVRFV